MIAYWLSRLTPMHTRFTWWCSDCARGESFNDRAERDADADRHRRLAHVEAPSGVDA